MVQSLETLVLSLRALSLIEAKMAEKHPFKHASRVHWTLCVISKFIFQPDLVLIGPFTRSSIRVIERIVVEFLQLPWLEERGRLTSICLQYNTPTVNEDFTGCRLAQMVVIVFKN